jgi:hypothetical protein
MSVGYQASKQNLVMTLRQFQESNGILPAEQIILLHNKAFFDGYEPLLPAPGRKQSRALSNRLVDHAIGKLEKHLLRLPDYSGKIFLGYYNQSFDQLRTLLSATYELIRGSRSREFELMVGKGDYEVDASVVAGFPSNLRRLTANNVNVDDSRIGYLPVGRDFRNRDLLSDRRPNRSSATATSHWIPIPSGATLTEPCRIKVLLSFSIWADSSTIQSPEGSSSSNSKAPCFVFAPEAMALTPSDCGTVFIQAQFPS